MEDIPIYPGFSSCLIGALHRGIKDDPYNPPEVCDGYRTTGLTNMNKVIRETPLSGNKYIRRSRVYRWPSNSSNVIPELFDIYPRGNSSNGQQFVICDLQPLHEGRVINYDGGLTEICYDDVLEKVERTQPSIISKLYQNGAIPLPEIINYNGLEYFFFYYDNQIAETLFAEIDEVAEIKRRQFFRHTDIDKKMVVTAWQIRHAAYNAFKPFQHPKWDVLQAKLLAKMDFELFKVIAKCERIGKDSFCKIFGNELLSYVLATLTEPQAEAWSCITRALQSPLGDGSLSYAISVYQKEVRNSHPNSIKKLYDKAVKKLEIPIKKHLGKDNEVLGIYVSALIAKEMLTMKNLQWFA